MPSRVVEEIRENNRKNLRAMIAEHPYRFGRIVDTPLLLRYYDSPEDLNKIRLRNIELEAKAKQRLSSRSELGEQMEKARDTCNGYELCARQFDISDSVEKMYFDKYGEGFNGSPCVDPPGTHWVCPGCGVEYVMSLKVMRPKCSRCGRITPIGKLMRDGALHR